MAGASAWRKVEGVMGDRHIYHVNLRKCAQLEYRPSIHERTRDDGTSRETTGFEKNNVVRRIVGIKRVDMRTMDEMRVDVGVKENLKKK